MPMKNLLPKLVAALLAGTCMGAVAQTLTPPRPGSAQAQSSAVPLPATAGVVGSGPIVMPPVPRPANAPARARGDFTIHTHHLIYATLPGSLERPMYPNGDGIVVLDADNNYAFVKRIHVWDYAGSMTPEDISGVAASPATNMLYLSARGRLGAIDLATDRMVWTTTLDGKCCERPQVSADGKTLIVGSNLQDYWYKLDAKTGKLLATIHAPGSPSAHNLNLSADGKLAFLSPNGKLLQIADIETAKVIRTIPFPENIRVQVLNKDSSKIYVNQNNFLGYLVADTRTGKILQTVEVTSVDWRSVWNRSPRPRVPHGCPSHGIAITQDGKEVWLADALFNKIHIFSNTDNPKEIATIDTPDGVFWMTFGIDGKLVYASSGDIIDVATRKIVGTTKSEFGTRMFSEKELDMQFLDGHLQRVSNQFGNEYGDFVTAEKMGVGPHMPVLAGKASIVATPTGKDPNEGMPQASTQ
jgi:DNA-binding beta-propeller fold protein YncE